MEIIHGSSILKKTRGLWSVDASFFHFILMCYRQMAATYSITAYISQMQRY